MTVLGASDRTADGAPCASRWPLLEAGEGAMALGAATMAAQTVAGERAWATDLEVKVLDVLLDAIAERPAGRPFGHVVTADGRHVAFAPFAIHWAKGRVGTEERTARRRELRETRIGSANERDRVSVYAPAVERESLGEAWLAAVADLPRGDRRAVARLTDDEGAPVAPARVRLETQRAVARWAGAAGERGGYVPRRGRAAMREAGHGPAMAEQASRTAARVIAERVAGKGDGAA